MAKGKPQTWADLIIALLREPEDRRLQRALDRIVSMNCQVTKNPVRGFLYQGLAYRHTDCGDPVNTFKSIDPSLYGEVEAWLQDRVTIANELKHIAQSMRPLWDNSQSLQDVRDALPESLVSCFPPQVFKDLDRTRPEGWNLEPLSRAERQFRTIVPKLDAYTVARLLY
jgi:hypothetical protein